MNLVNSSEFTCLRALREETRNNSGLTLVQKRHVSSKSLPALGAATRGHLKVSQV